MRRTVLTALIASVGVVGACSGDTEPADPPIPTDALTTDTASPTDTETTTDAMTQSATSSTTEPATESPSESTTESPKSEAGAMPTMPDEAKEDTEAGAEAFVRHYIDVINYTGMNPETGLLEPLAADGCKSCDNHEASVSYSVENGDYLLDETFEVRDTVALFDSSTSTATVRASIHQPEQSYYVGADKIDRKLEAASATMVFRLQWDKSWKIQEITVDEAP